MDAGADGGVDGGGNKPNPVVCTNQLECGCTCVCAHGPGRVTYANCIFGFCEDCTPYCYDVCL